MHPTIASRATSPKTARPNTADHRVDRAVGLRGMRRPHGLRRPHALRRSDAHAPTTWPAQSHSMRRPHGRRRLWAGPPPAPIQRHAPIPIACGGPIACAGPNACADAMPCADPPACADPMACADGMASAATGRSGPARSSWGPRCAARGVSSASPAACARRRAARGVVGDTSAGRRAPPRLRSDCRGVRAPEGVGLGGSSPSHVGRPCCASGLRGGVEHRLRFRWKWSVRATADRHLRLHGAGHLGRRPAAGPAAPGRRLRAEAVAEPELWQGPTEPVPQAPAACTLQRPTARTHAPKWFAGESGVPRLGGRSPPGPPSWIVAMGHQHGESP